MKVGARWCVLLPALFVVGCAESTPPTHDAFDALEVHDLPETEDAAEAEGEVPGCRPGQYDCDGTCVDLTSDPAHCGRCDRACAPGEVCNEGACASTCTDGLTNCDGACVDLTSDPEHCGDCATACVRSEECRAGDCVCVPDCTGRECGDDGCGGSCGSCGEGFTCLPDGRCSCSGTPCGAACCGTTQVCLSGGCCNAAWRVETAASLRALARDTDGTLYVAGADGTQAYVAAYDACGVRLREQRFTAPAAATGNLLTALALGNAEVYVAGQALLAGDDPGNGLWARLPKTTLTPAWAVGLWGGDDLDEIWSVGVTAAGNGWMFGTTRTDAPPMIAWVVRGYADTGRACGFTAFGGETGTVGRGLVLSGGRVYLGGQRAGQGMVTSFADDECGFVAGPCPCTPSGTTVTVEVAGSLSTEVRALVDVAGSLYLAGFSDVGGDLGALVARLAGSTVTFAPRWNPTAQIDAFTELAADASGSALYAVGTRGWSGTGDAAQAVLARYGVAGLTAEWQTTPTGAWACWDVAVDAGGGIVVACSRTGSGSLLARCLPSGVCP